MIAPPAFRFFRCDVPMLLPQRTVGVIDTVANARPCAARTRPAAGFALRIGRTKSARFIAIRPMG